MLAWTRASILDYIALQPRPGNPYLENYLIPRHREAADFLDGRKSLPEPYMVLAAWEPASGADGRASDPKEGEGASGQLQLLWLDIGPRVEGIRLLEGAPDGPEVALLAFQWGDADREALKDVVAHTPWLPTRIGREIRLEWQEDDAVPVIVLSEDCLVSDYWVGVFREGLRSNVVKLYVYVAGRD